MPVRTQKNIGVAVVGSRGRMGREIVKLLQREGGFSVAARIDRPRDWPSSPRAAGIRGVIEFSTPEGLREALAWCVRHRVPIVTGTTGLSPADLALVKKAARRIPVLYSANMSLGVAIVRSLMAQLRPLRTWDFALEETHHKKKRDKPSGTAKMLAAHLKATVRPRTLSIRSHRRGRVPGTHELIVQGPDEVIRIEHTAQHRRVFARGAISAARWLFDKGKPGLYDINDLYKGR